MSAGIDQLQQETRVERARRYVQEGEERIARLMRHIAEVRVRGRPTEHLERLLDEYYEWLLKAQRNLMDEEMAASRRSTAPRS
jgi:hypothetical protein